MKEIETITHSIVTGNEKIFFEKYFTDDMIYLGKAYAGKNGRLYLLLRDGVVREGNIIREEEKKGEIEKNR